MKHFMAGRANQGTNLLSFYNKVFEAVDQDENYDVVYLDLSKSEGNDNVGRKMKESRKKKTDECKE